MWKDLETKREYERTSSKRKIWMKEWKKTEAGQRWVRNGQYKTKYGITLDHFNQLHEDQNGLCKICGNPPSLNGYHGKFLYVDHSHETKAIRGLVCRDCNLLLGYAHENPDILRKAAEYLEK